MAMLTCSIAGSTSSAAAANALHVSILLGLRSWDSTNARAVEVRLLRLNASQTTQLFSIVSSVSDTPDTVDDAPFRILASSTWQ